ncbi:MAG: hypothetical protein EOO61_03735 [Hymenobacter sp.]|nr:MAG: hypothetical protein EOO61_03735 [Hymenobacter sp.]
MKKRAFRWSLGLGMLLLLASACHSRTRRYAAFEDAGVGSYTVNLYTNGEYAVEMGLGYHEGRYTQQGDTLPHLPGGPAPGPTYPLAAHTPLSSDPAVAAIPSLD